MSRMFNWLSTTKDHAPMAQEPRQEITLTLKRNELSFMMRMVNQRVLDAIEEGIPDDHESSIFRNHLLKRLSGILCDSPEFEKEYTTTREANLMEVLEKVPEAIDLLDRWKHCWDGASEEQQDQFLEDTSKAREILKAVKGAIKDPNTVYSRRQAAEYVIRNARVQQFRPDQDALLLVPAMLWAEYQDMLKDNPKDPLLMDPGTRTARDLAAVEVVEALCEISHIDEHGDAVLTLSDAPKQKNMVQALKRFMKYNPGGA